MGTLRNFLSRAVAATPLAYWPVTVKAGPAAGARWTLAPFSQNWRTEGENDVARGLAFLPKLEGSVCWDFGAHFGIHTVGMAMQVGAQGQVAAFEPDPVAFKRLSYHVRINRLANVRLHQVAVSNKTGNQDLVEVQAWGRHRLISVMKMSPFRTGMFCCRWRPSWPTTWSWPDESARQT